MRIIYILIGIMLTTTIFAQSKALHFRENGKFRIVQFTDLHYKPNESGERSLALMKRTLELEKPDLIVFTGDVVVCEPQRQGWDDVLNIAIDAKIPYAVVLGNHDDEQDWTRAQIFNYISSKPLSLSKAGPSKLKGTGNYVLKISDRKSKAQATLYLFDSNAYNRIGQKKGYDWLGFDQVEWYRKTSRAINKANEPYPSLAFLHIPFQEYTLLQDTTKNYVKSAPFFGLRKEQECPGLLNTGMFAAMVERGDVMGVFAGHDHDNDYIGCLNEICLAYGRFGGAENSYNSIGLGARVIELTAGSRTFETWIRNEANEVLYKVAYPASFEQNNGNSKKQ